jgi:uncharacterized protein YjbI with pentapeptide repeats
LQLTDCRLEGCDFSECDLSKASFDRCQFSEGNFTKCDLRSADFRSASGWSIDPATNQLRGARFSFPEAVALLKFLGIRLE